LRGNIIENLTAWILESGKNERKALLREFREVFVRCLQHDDDAWPLDHLFRLFHRLSDKEYDEDLQLLLADGVSDLLGDREFYKLNRKDFLLRIEKRKRESSPKRG
jgi:hypothetical protein